MHYLITVCILNLKTATKYVFESLDYAQLHFSIIKLNLNSKVKVTLFYHESQDKSRINNFINKFNSIIDFDDLTLKKTNDLEDELEKDNLIFILFDRQTDDLIDATREAKKSEYCKCQLKTECKCDLYKKFYELIYKMYLDRKNKK